MKKTLHKHTIKESLYRFKKTKRVRHKKRSDVKLVVEPKTMPFIYGVATSSFQIEGSLNADGRTPSIWEPFCEIKDKVFEGHTGEIACDHYNQYREDVALMDWLGVDAYRFSVSWSRIFPEKHKPNPEGLKFYLNLISELEQKGIKPCLTLYHWDLPIWAQREGGWTNRKCVDWFLEYATYLFEQIGDRVTMWFTHNEPFCSGILGHTLGLHAPGYESVKEGFLAVHHLLLSHGKAVKRFREMNMIGEIGIVLSVTPLYPDTSSQADYKSTHFADAVSHRLFLEALFKGTYPKEVMTLVNRITRGKMKLHPHDMETISKPCDFLGINYYTRGLIKTKSGGIGYEAGKPRVPVTDMGWEVIPYALKTMIERIRVEFTKLPIYITENGAAYPDHVERDFRIHDEQRIIYLKRHLEMVHAINEEGGNIKGYFLWSLFDNFEWQEGYSKRFGLFYVDYNNLKRYPKDSAYFYMEYIRDQKKKRLFL